MTLIISAFGAFLSTFIWLFLSFPGNIRAQTLIPPSFSHSYSGAPHQYQFLLKSAGVEVATHRVPKNTPVTLNYSVEAQFDTQQPLPHTHLIIWKNVPYPGNAEHVETLTLPQPKEGEVVFSVPNDGSYYLVLFTTLREDPESLAAIAKHFRRGPDQGSHYPEPGLMESYAILQISTSGMLAPHSSVLFLPGIKGSRLFTRDGEKLWEPFGNGDVEQLMHDTSGASIRSDIITHPWETIATVAGVTDIYRSFSSSLSNLAEEGEIAEWWPAAYDWRLRLDEIVNDTFSHSGVLSSLPKADTPFLIDAITTLANDSPTGRVTIVAHSNGGLVTKRLLEEIGDTAVAQIIDKIILVGVPQIGAPQAIPALLHGYKEGLPWWFPAIVSTPTARAYAENSPMAYHLLPSAKYNHAHTPETPLITFSGDTQYSFAQKIYGEEINSFEEFSSFAKAEFLDRTKPEQSQIGKINILNSSLLSYAHDEHVQLDDWEPPTEIEVHQIAGTGKPTISGIRYYDRCVLDICVSLMRPSFLVDGDGVVPVSSALFLPESANVFHYYVPLTGTARGALGEKDHGTMLAADAIQKLIASILLSPSRTKVGDVPDYDSAFVPEKIATFVHTDAVLSLVDTQGNIIRLSDSILPEEFSDLTFGQIGTTQYVISSQNSSYELLIEDISDDSLTLEQEYVGKKQRPMRGIIKRRVLPGTRATLALGDKKNQSGDSVIHIDNEGDGTFEEEIPLVSFPEDSEEHPLPDTSGTDTSEHEDATVEENDDSSEQVTPETETTKHTNEASRIGNSGIVSNDLLFLHLYVKLLQLILEYMEMFHETPDTNLAEVSHTMH